MIARAAVFSIRGQAVGGAQLPGNGAKRKAAECNFIRGLLLFGLGGFEPPTPSPPDLYAKPLRYNPSIFAIKTIALSLSGCQQEPEGSRPEKTQYEPCKTP